MTDHPAELRDSLTDNVPAPQRKAADFTAAILGDLLTARYEGIGDVSVYWFANGPRGGGFAYKSFPTAVYLRVDPTTSLARVTWNVVHETRHLAQYDWAAQARLEGRDALAAKLDDDGPWTEKDASDFADRWAPAIYRAGVASGWDASAVKVCARDLPHGKHVALGVDGKAFLPGCGWEAPPAPSWHVIRKPAPHYVAPCTFYG